MKTIEQLQSEIGYFKPELLDIKNTYILWHEKQDGYAFVNKAIGITVIITGEVHNNKKWLHVSFSRKSRMPDYNDISRIKKDFFGDNRKVIMIFPEKENHVNIHPYCLHLFHCIDGDGLPEFSREGNL